MNGFSVRGGALLQVLLTLVIAVALSVLGFSAYSKAVEASRRARCASNLRQAGIALLHYISDSNQRIHVQIGGGNLTMGWTKRIVKGGYIPKDGAPQILRCHAREYRFDANRGESWFWETYGINLFKHPNHRLVPYDDGGYSCFIYDLALSAIPEPGNHILLADSADGIAPDFWQTHSMKTRDAKSGIALRHNGFANAFYADGHIEIIDRQRAETSGIPPANIYQPSK